SSNNTQSNTSSSSSSDQQKTDRHSHYSSTSTDNDISIDLKPQTDLSPLKLLRNGINPSSITSKHMRQQLSAHDTSSSNHSPISSTSNTLSNLSITSPLYEHHLLLLPPPSQSSSSSNNDDNRSLSSLNSRSLSINKSEQNSITGQPLPPPPDLSSLGSKLTTATMTHTLKLPAPLTSSTSNPYRSKSMKSFFTCSIIYSMSKLSKLILVIGETSRNRKMLYHACALKFYLSEIIISIACRSFNLHTTNNIRRNPTVRYLFKVKLRSPTYELSLWTSV
ncbi:unnamed protein product, partial [Rotaria magnacalcarata]